MICKLTPPGTAVHYIAPQVRINLDDFGSARVVDAIIAGTGRDAVFGSVSASTSKSLRISWELSGVKPNPHETRYSEANLLMRLTITRSNGTAHLAVIDKSNRYFGYRAEGKCAITD